MSYVQLTFAIYTPTYPYIYIAKQLTELCTMTLNIAYPYNPLGWSPRTASPRDDGWTMMPQSWQFGNGKSPLKLQLLNRHMGKITEHHLLSSIKAGENGIIVKNPS